MKPTYLKGFVLLVFGLGVVHCCNEQAIQSCAATFAEDIKDKNVYESEQVFKNFCDDEFATFKTCISEHNAGCGIAFRKTFEGIFNSYDYLCNDGSAGAVKYGACTDGSANKQTVDACRSDMNSKIQQNSGVGKICGYIDDYLTCVYDGTNRNCPGSASWYEKAIHLATGPILEEAGCGCTGLTATITLLAGAFLLQWLLH